MPACAIGSDDWNFVVGEGTPLFLRLGELPSKVGDIAERIAQGIRTSANEVYVLDLVSRSGNLIEAYSKQLERNVLLERDAVRLFLQGREIKRYQVLHSGKVVIIPYDAAAGGQAQLLSKDEYQAQYPETFSYLLANKKHLENRERGRMRGAGWYGYVYPKNLDVMSRAKILVPDIADRTSFAIDDSGEYAMTSGYGITLKSDIPLSPTYLLGLLNSPVLDFYLKKISTTLRGGFFRYFTQYIEQLPLPQLELANPQDRERHDRLVGLVDHILALHLQLPKARTGHEQTALRRQIESTDAEIDRLVYNLYGLTEDEIRIVEEAGAR